MSSDQPRTRHRPSKFTMDDAAYAQSSSSSEASDRGTQSHYSRRVLAHVLARKERDSKQMHQLLKLTFAKLDEESQRATDAERRAAECLVRARAAIDARAQADADAASVRTELAMYKLQLDQAQREIFRAQELLTGLETRRHDAEEDAARARNVARKLQEERAVDTAREEGKQQGWREGLRRGMLLGRQEAEEELIRSSRRRDEDIRSRSRHRRVDDPHFTRAPPDHVFEESSPDQVTPPSRNRRHSPDISPPAPHRASPYDHRGSTPELSSSIRRWQHNEDIQRSRSRPPPDTPSPPPAVPEPARSRPYTPHDESTPSIIHPIPVPASVSSTSRPLPVRPSPSPSPTVHHAPRQITPDNWIPRAQDAAGDGRLSIYIPPAHDFVEPLHAPDGPYAIAATPEEGSPAVVPPQPELSPSPPRGYPTLPPQDFAPPSTQTPSRGRQRYPREREYTYTPQPPPPDLEPAVPNPRPPSRSRDYASAQPPPPNVHPPRRIAKVSSNHSRASTHFSEFDLLAPVGQLQPPPDEAEEAQQEEGEPEEELEYVDAPTEPIPRQPIAMATAPDPSLQRRRATYDRRRGPPPPRQIIMPALLSQARPVEPPPPPPPVPQSYFYSQQQAQQVQDSGDDLGFENGNEHDEDSPLLGLPPNERNRPHRSRTQSSGVIGISVEPPSPGGSPPSSGINTALQRRPDLLSPEHAERHLPMAMPVQIPYSHVDIYSGSRNKPQPSPPKPSRGRGEQQQDRPLTPLPELELAGLVPPGVSMTNPSSSPGASASDLHGSDPHSRAYRPTRSGSGMRYEYEAAPLPVGIEYPASPLGGQPGARPGGVLPRRRGTKTKEGGETPLSPLAVATGLLGLKGRLGMPWRRNTAK